MLKPQGLAASCGIEKGKISKSPIQNFSSILKYFKLLFLILDVIFSMLSKACIVEKTGISNLDEKVARPLTWSECSCVTKIASIEEASISMELNAFSIFLLLTPQSINIL